MEDVENDYDKEKEARHQHREKRNQNAFIEHRMKREACSSE